MMSRAAKQREHQESTELRNKLMAKETEAIRRESPSPFLSFELPAELPEGVTREVAEALLADMKSTERLKRTLAWPKAAELGIWTPETVEKAAGFAPSPAPVALASPETARQGLKVVHSESPPSDHNFEAETILIAASILRPKLRPAILAGAPPEAYHGAPQKKLIRLIAERHEEGKPIDEATIRDCITRDGPALDVGVLNLLELALKKKIPGEEAILEFAANVVLRHKQRERDRLRKEIAGVMLDGALDAGRLQQVAGELLKQLDSSTPNDWLPPILDDKIPAAPFPFDVLPAAMEDLALEIAQDACTAAETFLLPALTYAGTMIGNTIGLQLKRRWIERPLLWTAYVVKPGRGKTPGIDQATVPLMKIFYKLLNEYKAVLEDTPESKKDRLDPLQRLIVNNITWEALAKLLAGNPRGVAKFEDELSAWLLGMNQYKSGGGNDEENWISSWSGMPIIVDRKGQDGEIPIIARRPFVSITGGIQPDKLHLLKRFVEVRDGFMDRMLVSYPETVTPKWFDAPLDGKAYGEYEAMILRLWERKCYKGDDGEALMEVVNFTDDARDRWVEWYDAICQEFDAPDFPEHLEGAWSKFRIYCARFALLLDVLEQAYMPHWTGLTRNVSLRSLESAIRLVGYFQSHFRRVHAAIKGEKDHNSGACAVLAWVINSGRRRFTEAEAKENFRRSTLGSDPDALPRAFDWLKERRCIRVAAPSSRVVYKVGRKASILYEVNPHLFENGVCARFIRKP
jgi:Protein of unknown function (DUF3987)